MSQVNDSISNYTISQNQYIHLSKENYGSLPSSLPDKVKEDLHGKLYRVGSDESPIVASLYYKDGVFGYSNYLVKFIDGTQTPSEKKD